MIWGNTKQHNIDEHDRIAKWHKWFAWYPVTLEDGRFVWWQWVNKRTAIEYSYDGAAGPVNYYTVLEIV